MMSALTLKGVQLGPLLLTNQPTYLSATFMSMIVTNILMVIVAMAIAKVFAQILAIPYSYLGPIILMLALIGTYGDQMSATSVQIMVLAGVLGLIVRACHLNSAAIVLGLVLGSMCEQNFSRGYLMARANVLQMFNPALHPHRLCADHRLHCDADQPDGDEHEEKESREIKQPHLQLLYSKQRPSARKGAVCCASFITITDS